MKKIAYIVVGSLALIAVIAMVFSAAMWPMINEVETGATPEYPEIQPHYYSTDPGRIYDEAVATLESLEHWEISDQDGSNHRIEATRSTSLIGFIDDVTIRIEPVTEFVSQVHVHSESRVGKADLGQNARNIEEFFVELDDRLGAVIFEPERVGEQEADDVLDEADDEALDADDGGQEQD